MKTLLSRQRYLAAAFGVTFLLMAVHLGADTRPAGTGSSVFSALHRFVNSTEGRITDVKFRLRGPLTPHPDVLLAVIDEASVQRYGRWPWPRDVLARALERFHDVGAKAVGLDMTFTEAVPDASGQAYAEALRGIDHSLLGADSNVQRRFSGLQSQLRRHAGSSPDERLANALALAPQVVQGVITYGDADAARFVGERAQGGSLSPHLLTTFPGKVPGSSFPVSFDGALARRAVSVQLPLTIYRTVSPRWGHFSSEPESDGVTRQSPLFIQLSEPQGLMPSLALQTAAAFLDARIEPVWDPDLKQLVAARLLPASGPPRLVPLEPSQPTTFIDYVGGLDAFPRVSLCDVIDGTTPDEALRGKAILVGVTLLGEFDQIVTPYAGTEAGLVSHASLVSSILQNRYLTRPSSMMMLELLFMLASAFVLGRWLPRIRFALKGALVLGLGLLYIALDAALFSRGYRLAVFVPGVLELMAVSFTTIFLGYLSADLDREKLQHAFQHYLNKSVMAEMLANPSKLKLGGEKRELTVLFSDIRGFTTLAERMAPEALVKFINSYLTPMTEIVFDEGGTLDKYIGDAVMAFWGAPMEQADHALRAVRAALRFVDALEALKLRWRAENLPEFDIGVGINSGPMVVGNMGSDIRFDYTVMGDAVNLASRLEGTNKEYGTRLLMSEATYLLVKEHVTARRLGSVRVKGKRKPVFIYELRHLGGASPEEAAFIARFEQGLDAYTARRFDEAQGHFVAVLALSPEDGPSLRYLEDVGKARTLPEPGEHDA